MESSILLLLLDKLQLIYCHYIYHNTFDWSLLIAIISLLAALAAIIISTRFQLITFVNNQLIEIAKVCNSYLQEGYQVHKAFEISHGRASGIVTALEDGEKIINYYCLKSLFIFNFDKEKFRIIFYFNLHSSIRELLKTYRIDKKTFMFNPTEPKDLDKIINEQLKNACDFLQKEIDETIKSEDKRAKG